ncbi:poly [ADP-ribose] polymerase isoform X2 [Folsomia candida]|uniref:poly [ADP-ribose] polymerase isoform X2 n=1 Tax=Folsomia candida TaxID=158441 RepID=UPI000B90134A|nr:poly [ADP-ribose] polymerase isoform X2 [Folsomia candida]
MTTPFNNEFHNRSRNFSPNNPFNPRNSTRSVVNLPNKHFTPRNSTRSFVSLEDRQEYLARRRERAKEEEYLNRISSLMQTDRLSLDSSAKIKLWEDGPNHAKVVKYVNNSQCHNNVKLTVVNIHRVWRRGDAQRLLHNNRKLLWHGTKRSNIPAILQNGFRLPNSAGQMFGSGIYFADRITKSSNYSDQDATFLLLCEVGLGRIYSCAKSHNHLTAPPSGFESTKGNGTYVPDWTDNGNYMGSHIPFGRTARCTKYDSHAVLYNEFIVYDPQRIIVRFLVEVRVHIVVNPRTELDLVVPKDFVGKRKPTRAARAPGPSMSFGNVTTVKKIPKPTPQNLPTFRMNPIAQRSTQSYIPPIYEHTPSIQNCQQPAPLRRTAPPQLKKSDCAIL